MLPVLLVKSLLPSPHPPTLFLFLFLSRGRGGSFPTNDYLLGCSSNTPFPVMLHCSLFRKRDKFFSKSDFTFRTERRCFSTKLPIIICFDFKYPPPLFLQVIVFSCPPSNIFLFVSFKQGRGSILINCQFLKHLPRDIALCIIFCTGEGALF